MSTTSHSGSPESKLSPQITAVVCTRNRGDLAAATISSILSQDMQDFELLVVDQSEDDATRAAVSCYPHDPRVRYIRSTTVGLSKARNIALQNATAEYIAYTDDDCLVQPGWLATVHDILSRDSTIGAGFCSVVAGTHDTQTAYVPVGPIAAERTMCSLSGIQGIGAGLFVLRSACVAVGAFDEKLGAGAQFPAAEETDLCRRLLSYGYHIRETGRTQITHNGARIHGDIRRLLWNYEYGSGGGDIKLVRCGEWRIAQFGVQHLLALSTDMLKLALHGHKPRGLLHIRAYLAGAFDGLRLPLNKATRTYTTQEN